MSLPYLLLFAASVCWASPVPSPSPAICSGDPSFTTKLVGEYRVPFDELEDFLLGDEHFSQKWANYFQTKQQIAQRDSFRNFTIHSQWTSDDDVEFKRTVSYQRHNEVTLLGDSWLNFKEEQWYSTSTLGSIGDDIKERHLLFRKISESVVPVAGKMKIEVFYCIFAQPHSMKLIVDAKVAEVDQGFFGAIAKDQAMDGLVEHYKLIDFLLHQVEQKYQTAAELPVEANPKVELAKKERPKSNSSMVMFVIAFGFFCAVIGLSYFWYLKCCARPLHVPVDIDDPEFCHIQASGSREKSRPEVTFADLGSSK